MLPSVLGRCAAHAAPSSRRAEQQQTHRGPAAAASTLLTFSLHAADPSPALHIVRPLPRSHDGPWWLSRAAVIALLMVTVVVPTLVPRSLRVVAKFSSFSVCMLFLLASAISGLALAALARGAIAPGVSWLPSYAAIGGSPLGALTSVLTVVSGAAGGPGRGGALLESDGLLGATALAHAAAQLALWGRWLTCTGVDRARFAAPFAAVSALAFTCQFNLL